MAILFLIASLTASAGTFLIVSNSITKGKRFKCQTTIGIILVLGSFCLSGFSITRSTSAETSNSVKVAVIETNISIYQDTDSDEYFRLIEDEWNIFDIYDREYIDTVDAEKIIEVSEIVSSWDK